MSQSPINNRLKRALAVLLAFILVIGAGIAVYAVLKKRPSDQSQVAVSQPTSSTSTSKNLIKAGRRQPVLENRTPSSHDKPNETKPGQSKPNHKPETKPGSKLNQQSNPKPGSKPNAGSNPQSNQPALQSQPTPNNPTPAPQPTPTPQPQPPAPQPQPPVDPNHKLRQEIEVAYGVKVRYGASETNGYYPRGVTTDPLKPDQYADALKDLKGVLSHYPAGFFGEFRSNGMPLTFYLVNHAQGAFTGFFDWQFINNLKITLVRSDLLFNLTANHEITHAIDTFMEIKMHPNKPYKKYTDLNPAGFRYRHDPGGLSEGASAYVFTYNSTNKNNIYFTTEYGQTNPREDRAEVFKFMMRDRDSLGVFKGTPHIKAKARVIARQIEANFITANSSAYWNRFLK